jgi:hypothetical protein
LADLAGGRAHTRWYWRRWKRLFGLTPAEAIASILAEHADRMTAVVEELSETNALAPVWRTLSAEAAVRLLVELSRATRFHLSSPAPGVGPGRAPARTETLRSVEHSAWWPAVVRRWREPLAELAPQDARFRLAAALTAVHRFPIFLAHDTYGAVEAIAAALAQRLSEPAARLNPPVSQATGTQPEPPRRSAEAAAALETTAPPIETEAHPEIVTGPAYRPEARPEPGAPPREISRADRPLDERERKVPQGTPTTPAASAAQLGIAPGTAAPELPLPPLASAIADAPAARETPFFHTRQGGVFYLIDALNHPAVRDLIDREEAWTRLPSGWAWLFRVGETLGLRIDDPAALFMAREMGFDNVERLRELPELPLRDALLRLFETLYGRYGIWQQDLLEVDAEVAHTASHIDIHFPMSAVRLPVRLAALDINPGWVPWLGRVVTFHYESRRGGAL